MKMYVNSVDQENAVKKCMRENYQHLELYLIKFESSEITRTISHHKEQENAASTLDHHQHSHTSNSQYSKSQHSLCPP